MTLEGPTLKPAVRPSLYQKRQAKKVSSLEKSAASRESSAEANTRDDASQGKVPCLAHEVKTINSFSHAILVAGLPESDFSVASGNGTIQRNAASGELSSSRGAAIEAQQLAWRWINQEHCPGQMRQTCKRPKRHHATDPSRRSISVGQQTPRGTD
jgi:hypothetical protein